MSENKSFRRDAIYERSHLFIPGDNVIVAFRVRGNISREILEDALEKVQLCHPLINAHIEFDDSHKAWFVSDIIPPCKLKIIPRMDDNTWIEAVLAEYWQPFQITKEPLIRFLLVQGENKSEIIVFAQHAICDGLSLTFLLRDIMLVLGDQNYELPMRDNVPTIYESYNLDSIKINPLIKKIFEKINEIWTKNKIFLSMEDFAPLFPAFQNYKLKAVSWKLTQEITLKLISRCRKEGISVNSALYCAILNVQHLLQGDKESFRKRIMMPVNLRKYLTPPIDEVVGLYAGGERFEVKLNWKRDFWSLAKKVHKILLKRITPDSVFSQAKRVMMLSPIMMDARVMMFLGGLSPTPPPKYHDVMKIVEQDRFLAKMKEKNIGEQNIQYGTVLTNIGAINIPENYGAFQLERILFLPPSSPVAEKLIGVVTFKNQLQGTIAFAEKTLSSDTAEKFARHIEEFIQKQLM